MEEIRKMIKEAIVRGQTALSEHESKRILAYYGIPVVRECLVTGLEEIKNAAAQIGYPVVLKACSPELTHKTESGMVALICAVKGTSQTLFTVWENGLQVPRLSSLSRKWWSVNGSWSWA